MQNPVIPGLDPVIQFLDQVVKDWMPRSSRGMTWVGVSAVWYNLCVGNYRGSPMNDFILMFLPKIRRPRNR